jgi:hypothetical protein
LRPFLSSFETTDRPEPTLEMTFDGSPVILKDILENNSPNSTASYLNEKAFSTRC